MSSSELSRPICIAAALGAQLALFLAGAPFPDVDEAASDWTACIALLTCCKEKVQAAKEAKAAKEAEAGDHDEPYEVPPSRKLVRSTALVPCTLTF